MDEFLELIHVLNIPDKNNTYTRHPTKKKNKYIIYNFKTPYTQIHTHTPYIQTQPRIYHTHKYTHITHTYIPTHIIHTNTYTPHTQMHTQNTAHLHIHT